MKVNEIKELIQAMTLDEKIGMIHGSGIFHNAGVERLNIPEINFSDGPMGVRMSYQDTKWFASGYSEDYTSYLPSNTALAATWNRKLAYETGRVLGKEARGRGKDMILAPGINVQRTPLCGRNFEYMGEDPYLIAEMVVPLIKGIEENDVAACVKHFAVNNQETRRLDVDVQVDERALREIYLPGFEAAVKKANVKALMGAYNKLRGQFCCHNEYLLQDILRNEWGFKGITVSDWGGVHDTKEAALNGLDIEMSVTDNFDIYYMADALKKAITDGEIPLSAIDEKIEHILYVMNELHMLEGERNPGLYNDCRDRENLLKVAEESVVLLKNEEHILPIIPEKNMKILVVGDNANRKHATGGGSAEIKALYEVTPLLGITMAAGGNVKVTYEPGYDANTNANIWENPDDIEQAGQATSLLDMGKSHLLEKDPAVLAEKNKMLANKAVQAAGKADIVIFVGGLNHIHDTEGQDRESLKLPYDQETLIERLLQANKNTILVINAGSPVDMRSFEANVKAIVYSWYAGMEGGTALGRILFGQTNPSGKLPETFPVKIEDCGAHKLGEFPGEDKIHYNEGIYVGYRYYDTNKIKPAYAFGYGLSYTTFQIEDDGMMIQGTSDSIAVTSHVKVTNTGKVTGSETIQLYVRAKNSKVERPDKELKAFEKVFLNPGETKVLSLTLDKDAFRYYDVNLKSFVTESGEYEILVGNSSDNLVFTEKITV